MNYAVVKNELNTKKINKIGNKTNETITIDK